MKWLWGFRRRKRDRELEEEIRAHLAMAERDRIERGESHAEARLAVRREFGNEALVKEITREMWGCVSLERMFQDVRYALRTLRGNLAFTATAVASLALGIGANTATFSLSDALLMRPLPVAHTSEIVELNGANPESDYEPLSYPDYADIRDRSRSFAGMVGHRLVGLAVARTQDTVPQRKMAMYVTPGFFQVLGVEPARGRAFTDDETGVPGHDPVVVVSYEYWRTQLGGDPSAIGTALRLNGIPFTIIGIAPEAFNSLDQVIRPAFFVPVTMEGQLSNSPSSTSLDRRGDRSLQVKARLKPGVTIAQARAEMATLAAGLGQAYPDTNRRWTIRVRTQLEGRIARAPALGTMVSFLLALSALLLLIACMNVANLLLARARARSREIAVRLAIGAGRVRLFQQLITESIVLSLLGAAGGLVIAQIAIRFLNSIQLPTDTPMVLGAELDTRVLMFALVVALISAVLFGGVPALRIVRDDLNTSLRSGGRGPSASRRSVGRSVLVTVQVAASLVLLVVSAAFLDAFRKMSVADPGIRVDHLMMMEFDLGLTGNKPDQSALFFKRLMDRVRTLPGVRNAALARAIPFRPNFTEEPIVPEGNQFPRDQDSVIVTTDVVDENYFETAGTTLVRGRAFTARDDAGAARAGIVNEEFAKRFWPGQDAIGKRFRAGIHGRYVEVVGIAKNAKYLSLMEPPIPYVYLPFAQNPRPRMTLLIWTVDRPEAIVDPVLEEVRSIDPNQPVYNVRSFQTYYESGVLGLSLVVLQMVGTTGFVGLALALIGLYGLIAYGVATRTREIGVRMAIGATRGDILRLVLGQGLTISLVGAAIGLALAVPVFRVLAASMVGVGPLSTWTLAIVPAGLISLAALASYFPARRASAIRPTVALRYE